jgi:cytochrome c oxidase assembly protein subunit 15
MSGLIWTALDLRQLARTGTDRPAGLSGLPLAALLVLAVQLCWGAFVAGLDAGFIFAEWPLMGGKLFPEGVTFLTPLWHNAISNPVIVQFIHRWYAWFVAALIFALALRLRNAGEHGLARAVFTVVLLQIGLGISTLLSGVAIPIAVGHQALGAILLALTVTAAHRLGRTED